MKFVSTKKFMTTNFFSSLSFVAVFGSGIRDQGSGIRNGLKIRMMDKHPGSAELLSRTLHRANLFLLLAGRWDGDGKPWMQKVGSNTRMNTPGSGVTSRREKR